MIDNCRFIESKQQTKIVLSVKNRVLLNVEEYLDIIFRAINTQKLM